MIQTNRDEVFYNLFKDECNIRNLEWFYTVGVIRFASKNTVASEFFDRCIVLDLGATDQWFHAYSGLIKWCVEQDVTKVTPEMITATIWQWGIDRGITKKDAMEITELIYKNDNLN